MISSPAGRARRRVPVSVSERSGRSVAVMQMKTVNMTGKVDNRVNVSSFTTSTGDIVPGQRNVGEIGGNSDRTSGLSPLPVPTSEHLPCRSTSTGSCPPPATAATSSGSGRPSPGASPTSTTWRRWRGSPSGWASTRAHADRHVLRGRLAQHRRPHPGDDPAPLPGGVPAGAHLTDPRRPAGRHVPAAERRAPAAQRRHRRQRRRAAPLRRPPRSRPPLRPLRRVPHGAEGRVDGEPFDFTGEHYQVENAMVAKAPDPRPAIFFGGSSEAGTRVAARHADVWLMWGEPPQPPPPSWPGCGSWRRSRAAT